MNTLIGVALLGWIACLVYLQIRLTRDFNQRMRALRDGRTKRDSDNP